MFLEAHFGDVTIPDTSEEEDWLVLDVKVDDVVARVDLISMVSCGIDDILSLADHRSVWNANLQIYAKG
jgi:hypothetical protein